MATAPSPSGHWDGVYRERGSEEVSWYQAEPQPSLDLIRSVEPGRRGVIDVGGGASPLGPRLIADGFADVTVLDVSEEALGLARRRPGADGVEWVCADLLTWRPGRAWRVWHDRAVFHFLTGAADRAAYLAVLREALAPGGAVVLGVFAPDGPSHCSGLP